MKKIRVVVLYRVVQHWRCPMFQRIANLENVSLKVFYGADFKGTKVVSGEHIEGFAAQKLPTIKITKKHNGIERQMPFCPSLLLKGNQTSQMRCLVLSMLSCFEKRLFGGAWENCKMSN